MGGLKMESNEKKVFLSIVGGKFAKRVNEGTEGAIEREIEYENKKRMVWEIHYSSLEAMIDSVELKEGEKFGDQLQINMSYVDDRFTVTLPLQSREGKAFMMCLPNLKLKEVVTLQPYNYTRKSDQKHLQGMGIVQGTGDDGKGLKVPFGYMEDPAFPAAPKQGEGEQLDKDEFKLLMQQQTIWLKKKTKAFIAANFAWSQTASNGKVTPNQNVGKAGDEKPKQPAIAEDEPNDLPFRFAVNYASTI